MSILKRIQEGTPNGQTSPNVTGEGGDRAAPTLQARRQNAPNVPSSMDTYQDLKTRVQNKLLDGLGPSTDPSKAQEVRKTIQDLFTEILSEEHIVLSRPEQVRMNEQIVAEILNS